MSVLTLQKFTIILLFGGLILQSFVLLSNPMKTNKKANFCFGLFLLLWSSFWFLDILEILGIAVNSYLSFFAYTLQIFTPIFLFFSVVFFVNPNYKFRRIDSVCLITPVLYLILLFGFSDNKSVMTAIDFVAVFHNLPYIAIVYFRIKKYQKKIETISSYADSIDLKWLEKLSMLLFGIIVLTVSYELFNMFVYKLNQHLVMDVLFLYIVYNISYHILSQREIYPVDIKEREELLSVEFAKDEKPEKKKLIPDEDFDDLKNKLINVVEDQKPYLDGELNLSKLAAYLSINAHQLSYLLNNGFNKNFFQFVNTYRVEYAKKLLSNTNNQKPSMLEVAFESGFNSKTSFNTIFKKMTGETPSDFRKKHSGL